MSYTVIYGHTVIQYFAFRLCLQMSMENVEQLPEMVHSRAGLTGGLQRCGWDVSGLYGVQLRQSC